MSAHSYQELISGFQNEIYHLFPEVKKINISLRKDSGGLGKAMIMIQLKGKVVFIQKRSYKMIKALRKAMKSARQGLHKNLRKIKTRRKMPLAKEA